MNNRFSDHHTSSPFQTKPLASEVPEQRSGIHSLPALPDGGRRDDSGKKAFVILLHMSSSRCGRLRPSLLFTSTIVIYVFVICQLKNSNGFGE
jgi:hypothetical protein